MSAIALALIIYALATGACFGWMACASIVNRRWDEANEEYQRRTVATNRKV